MPQTKLEQQAARTTDRLTNLLAIAAMKHLHEEPTKLFGFLPTGGREDTLSPEESAVAGTIAKALHLKTKTTKGPLTTIGPNVTQKQWSEIAKDAAERAQIRKTGVAGAGGTSAKSLENQIASSPYNQIMQAVGKEYAVAEQASQAAASGSLSNAATTGAWSQALQSLAGAPSTLGMTPSAWLGQNIATANQTTAPLQQAMSNYGAALGAQQAPILANISALGQGLGAEDVTAGANAWLNALASHVTSNLSYYGQIPASAVSSLPSAVAQALKSSGGYPGGTQKGLISLGALTLGGATPTVKANAGGLGTTLAGTAPGSATSAGPAAAGQ